MPRSKLDPQQFVPDVAPQVLIELLRRFLRLIFFASTLGGVVLTSACGDHGTGRVSAAAPPAATVALSPELQAVYDRSCKNCHAVPASGAPQAGDAQAWAPRIAQGADILIEHTFSGYKSMPPLGACMDCNEKQYRALIEYMSGASTKN